MYLPLLVLLGALCLQNYLVSPTEDISGRSYGNSFGTSNNYAADINSLIYDNANANQRNVQYNNNNGGINRNGNIYTGSSYNKETPGGNNNRNEGKYNEYRKENSETNQNINKYYGNSDSNYPINAQIQGADSINQYTPTNSNGFTNAEYAQMSGYYRFPTGFQERFHPHGHIHSHDDDSHTGEVVLSPLQPAASQNVVNAVNPSGAQDSFFDAASSFSNFQTDPFAQGSDTASIQEEPPSSGSEVTPPTLPNGYDYHPPPPPLPPPPAVPAATPYYYYPPPTPPATPSNQYLPVVTHPPPPPQYLPAPTPPPPPSNHYLPVEVHHPEPEEERQVDYTYYYLGPKLWYVPLFFSIYFVLYVGALIIKAVSKHKILFPQQLYNAATSVYQARWDAAGASSLDLLTDRVTSALTTQALRYLRTQALGND